MPQLSLRRVAFVATLAAFVPACSQSNGAGVPPSVAPYRADGKGPVDVVQIKGIGRDPQLDELVISFMLRNDVPNAELAVGDATGSITFSHAYTYLGVAPSTTERSTIIRLASLSKAWTSAALYNLISAHEIEPNWKVFKYLGITKPLPVHSHVDPRVYDITIEDMILHESGWDSTIKPDVDPTFRMRKIALSLGLKVPIDRTQLVRHQLQVPLQEKPGTTYAYCNFCYTALGMVVAKASGMSYQAYLTKIDSKIDVNNVWISPTVGARLPNEVAKYYNPYRGRSALYLASKREYPYPYSGDGLINEVSQGAGGLATNADSMLKLMNHYIIWGVGTPPPLGQQAAREGEMPGANTYSAQLTNGKNYAFLVNTNAYAYGSLPNAFIVLQNEITQDLLTST